MICCPAQAALGAAARSLRDRRAEVKARRLAENRISSRRRICANRKGGNADGTCRRDSPETGTLAMTSASVSGKLEATANSGSGSSGVS